MATILMLKNKHGGALGLLAAGATVAVPDMLALDMVEEGAAQWVGTPPPYWPDAIAAPVAGAGNRRGQALTRAGSFAADAVAKSIAVGWRPDFLVAKSSAAAAAALQTNLAWHRRTDALINLESVGRADTPVGADTGGGITLTETGFDVGANSRVNGNGATIYWWVFRDQLSKSLLQSSYAGNAVAGRPMYLR